MDNTGVEHRGRFLRTDDQDLVMRVATSGGSSATPSRESTVREIRKNGAIIGALIGAPFGVMGSLFTGNLGPFLASAGAWMAIGIGLDAAHQGRTRVYSGVTTTTAQSSEGRRTSVQFSIRW